MVVRVTQSVCLVFVLALIPSSLRAQTNIESNAGIQFDFANPGARSLALGGAFVGLADDATAAFTNPAGLRFISRKEVSVEGRYWGFTTPFTSGGRLAGSPTRQGIDQTAGLTTDESRKSAAGLSFLSFVYPTARWAIAAYRQQLADFKYSASSQGPFVQLPAGDSRLFPYQATLHLKIARDGVSGAYNLGKHASVGAGIMVYDFSMDSDTRRFGFSRIIPQFYAAPDFSAAPVSDDTQTGTAQAAGVTVGLTVTPTSHVQLGAVYRQGANLGFVTTAPAATGSGTASSPATFRVPSVFSAGVSFRLADSLTVALDYSRVQYSQMTNNFTLFFPAGQGFTARPEDFKVDDANEVHAGVEYTFLKISKPIVLRGGSWYDPDHAIRFEPANAANADPYDVAVFHKGKNVVHGTGGVGVVLGQVEINAAADYSSRTKTASLSTVVRF